MAWPTPGCRRADRSMCRAAGEAYAAGCLAVVGLCVRPRARPACGGTIGSAGGHGRAAAPAPCEASGMTTFRAEQFDVRVSDEVLADLRARILNTRWPGAAPGAAWGQGTDLGYLQGLLGYWADGFDWRAQERWLNGFGHFRAGIDGVRVHFVHERARSGRGIPVILTNGWPSCFAEFLPLVPRLTDPAAHGIDGPGFDVVIPSLPGYGFSDTPAR